MDGDQCHDGSMDSTPVTVTDVRATIAVGDLEPALEFLTGIGGFTVDTTMGEPPIFALVSSGSARLGIVAEADPRQPEFCPVFITVQDLDLVVAGLDAAGVDLEAEPTDRPWNVRDLVVRCPGGGPLLAFGQNIGPSDR